MHPVLAYSQSFASISNLILESHGVGWRDNQWSLAFLQSGYDQPYANAGSSLSFQETVFPNSLYGEILDTVWKQTCQNLQGFWRKYTKKDLVTWSLTSSHRITNNWHQLPRNDPVRELSSGLWTMATKHPSLTLFLDLNHSFLSMAWLCYNDYFSSRIFFFLSSIKPPPVWDLLSAGCLVCLDCPLGTLMFFLVISNFCFSGLDCYPVSRF